MSNNRHTFYGSSVRDDANSLAVDENENLYVTGNSTASWQGPDGQNPLQAHTGSTELFVLKLSSNGFYQWHTFFETNQFNYARSSVVYGNGYLFITGSSPTSWDGPDGQPPLHALTEGPSSFHDIFILKLDSDGVYQWHTFYGSEDWDSGSSLAVDESGNLFITGVTGAPWEGPNGQPPLHAHSGRDDIVVISLDSNGAYQWHTFYGAEYDDWGSAIVTDRNGNLYVTGDSGPSWKGPSGQKPLNAFVDDIDILILKLDSAGTYQWHTFHGGDNADYCNFLAIGDSGNLFMTGRSQNFWNGPNDQTPLHTYSGSDDLFVFHLSK